jgi:SAM-dependent methyltransferase
VNCPGCEGSQARVTYALPRYAIVRCAGCGLLYNRDFPEPEALAETFSETYYRQVQREAFAHIGDATRVDPSRPIYERGLSLVEARRPPGRLLDVGCAFGAFLELAAGRGWKVSGVEISPYSSRYAREVRGLDVFTGDLADAPFAAGEFDLVTLWDVIEHVRRARRTVERAAQLLRPGGHLIITTDNYRSLLSVLGDTMYRLSLGTVRYPIERFFIPYNSCYFTRRDVQRLLEGAGMRELHCEGIDYPLDKIELTAVERALLRAIYRAGDLLHMNSQFLLVASKG